MSHDGRAAVLRQHAKNSRIFGEKIKLSDNGTNVARLSYESKMKIRYIRGKVARYIFKIRPKFVNLSQKCLYNETSREIYFQN